MDKYNPKYIEKKWQKYWEENPDLYRAKDASDKEKRFILDMFPYPSGEGLHTGHVESYTATDIVSRYLRMSGKDVLHPQGFDAFGLPAENYAVKSGVHPSETTRKAIKNFTRQMKMMGFSYDWSREVVTSDPDYYKWTQWFFLLLYKHGLAYKERAKVNWCPSCQTVLANEQVEDGVCERCKNNVIQKDLEQWFFKITEFIEDKPLTCAGSTRTDADNKKSTDALTSVCTSGLLPGLDKIDWPESTKLLQKNWIGKSEGAIAKFQITNDKSQTLPALPTLPTGQAGGQAGGRQVNSKQFIEVFTTRLDTIYGAAYVVVAPEHPLVESHKSQITNYKEVAEYVEKSKKKSDLMRMEEKDKTGVEIKGLKLINPFTKEELPLWVADYVLSQYGTGAVMGVPAHDIRDREFASKYGLSVKEVVIAENDNSKLKNDDIFIDDGVLIDSGKYSNLKSEKAREKMAEWLEKNDLGKRRINYRLRDWLVSRQRYWGAPIPIIYCHKCSVNSKSQKTNHKQIQNSNDLNSKQDNFETTIIDGEEYAVIPVPEKDLPVMLPDDVDFLPTGESPLKYSKKFQNVKCPICGGHAKRESDTMDTFVCSSWYYFRYADPKNEKEFADKNLIREWLPVDLYVGGAEHSVLHLLYSRFFTKVLHNLGYIDFDEPFMKLRHQGMILAEDGRKMSKSLGNVINPDDEAAKWGADSLRLFEMFMGPLEDAKPWNTQGIVGMYRFLEKVWKLQDGIHLISNSPNSPNKNPNLKFQNSKLDTLVHKTIKKVTEDVEAMRFNTAISQLMILANAFEKEKEIYMMRYTLYLILLSSFVPHIAEELWNRLGNTESIFREKWPEYDPELIKEEEIELVIQVNGKVRDRLKVPADISEDEAKEKAMESEKVKSFIDGKRIRKVIFVKGRLMNMVVA